MISVKFFFKEMLELVVGLIGESFIVKSIILELEMFVEGLAGFFLFYRIFVLLFFICFDFIVYSEETIVY